MLVTLLQATVAAGASDLHLTVGRPATARRDGVLVPFEGVSLITPEESERIVRSLLTLEQQGAEHFFGEPALELADLSADDWLVVDVRTRTEHDAGAIRSAANPANRCAVSEDP